MEERDRLSLVALLLLRRRRRRKQQKHVTRRYWIKPWIARRKDLGVFTNLIKEIECEDPETFRQFHRVDIDQFRELLNKVGPCIQKANTIMRECIGPGERLAATLRFLATGESFRSLSFQFRIGERTLSKIVIETCHAIYDVMKDEYFKMPSTADEWVEVANGFRTKWNYPNCIGAIDGKHFAIRQPPDTGSQFFNYKHFFSVLMLALVDSNYKFLYVNVGAPGRAGDAGVFSECSLKESLIKDNLHLPPPGVVHGMQEKLPYHIIGDDAFPMSTSLLKPYPQRNLDKKKRIYNYRFCRARRTVENAFGIMANRFRVFLSAINLDPDKVVWLILAACSLHNFLVERNKGNYLAAADIEDTANGTFQPGIWRSGGDQRLLEMQPIPGRNASQQAKHQRDLLAEYFSSEEGSVPWQEKMVTVSLDVTV